MTAKEYLEGIRIQDRKVEMKQRELQHLRETLDVIGICYDNTGTTTATRKVDETSEIIARVIDFENELKNEEFKLAIMRINATSAISSLNSEQQKEVLIRRYLLFENPEKIAEVTTYSKSYVYALCRDGLKSIPDFKNNTK